MTPRGERASKPTVRAQKVHQTIHTYSWDAGGCTVGTLRAIIAELDEEGVGPDVLVQFLNEFTQTEKVRTLRIIRERAD